MRVLAAIGFGLWLTLVGGDGRAFEVRVLERSAEANAAATVGDEIVDERHHRMDDADSFEGRSSTTAAHAEGESEFGKSLGVSQAQQASESFEALPGDCFAVTAFGTASATSTANSIWPSGPPVGASSEGRATLVVELESPTSFFIEGSVLSVSSGFPLEEGPGGAGEAFGEAQLIRGRLDEPFGLVILETRHRSEGPGPTGNHAVGARPEGLTTPTACGPGGSEEELLPAGVYTLRLVASARTEATFAGFANTIATYDATLILRPAGTPIADILDFFDDAVDRGDLLGVGPGSSGPGRLDAFRNGLVTMDRMLVAGKTAAVCAKLRGAALRSDGQPKPSDFVGGQAVGDLHQRLVGSRVVLGCE